MVALQKDLVASANAHHAVANFGEARGRIGGSEEDQDAGAEQEGLRESADLLSWLRLWERNCHRLLS